MSSLVIEPGSRILFQGDSITDAGRNKEDGNSLGGGYANMIAAWLSAQYPDRKLVFLNRGISGNTVFDLEKRWTADCIKLKPDWLSIMIGINDTGHQVRGEEGYTPETYNESYRRILDRVKAETKAQLIIIEPFLVPGGKDQEAWRDKLDALITLARTIARDYDARYLPLDGLFAAVSTRREPGFWSGDKVHPTPAGHALMAQAWIRTVTEG